MKSEQQEACIAALGFLGRSITESKSRYARQYPEHLVVFNANVCTRSYGKIWFGDLDVTKDMEKLTKLARTIGEDIYVLREMDALFNNHNNPQFDSAVVIFRANSNPIF